MRLRRPLWSRQRLPQTISKTPSELSFGDVTIFEDNYVTVTQQIMTVSCAAKSVADLLSFSPLDIRRDVRQTLHEPYAHRPTGAFMTKNMLIDAIHPEETRVVVTDHNQIQEFDFESQSKAPLRGNIYLAKITRVEPSLQAAFVEYGGNRHGFLAFNEIHPDYYQIPVGDREELLKEQAEEDRSQAASDDDQIDGDAADSNDDEENASGDVADVGGDAHEEAAPAINTRALHRKYKIQEVIKRRQVILVQVMKEERGNKGAALTTYLSLAGRYCVLMPNTARGGGISRKINNSADRKKLKTIINKLDVTDGMGLIVRTAGAQRTLTEIRRDFTYLTRLWEEVREKTVSSTAPTLVYEEGNLIRRCIRDLYSKEFDKVVIDGADSYKEAKNYMKLLMPSHARKVKQHAGDVPLFKEHGVEDKLAAMFNPIVVLPSGGYLVINPTEALVSIDVNSGKSTREQSVEKTALATNLEAAVEVARQARLRDLAACWSLTSSIWMKIAIIAPLNAR